MIMPEVERALLLEGFATKLEIAPYENGKPSFDLSRLQAAYHMGPEKVLAEKNTYINRLIGYRLEQGLGPNLKTQAQLVLQRYGIGDRRTWLADPSQIKDCIDIGEFLFKTEGSQEVWIGTALDDDMTDVRGEKNTPTPLIKGLKNTRQIQQIVDLFYGRITLEEIDPEVLKANTNKRGKQALKEVYNFIPNIYAHKLAKRWAMASHKSSSIPFNELLEREKRDLIAGFLPTAQDSIHKILTGVISWQQLNRDLEATGLAALNPENHPLLKMFSQDKNEWKIGDILASPESIIVEIPSTKFTHREDNGGGMTRIKFIVEDGVPVTICDTDDEIWLEFILNSRKFLRTLEQRCVPKLGKSPYYQAEIMFNTDRKQIAFATDVIAGIHSANKRDQNGIQPLLLTDLFTNIKRLRVRTRVNQNLHELIDKSLPILTDLEQGDVDINNITILRQLAATFPNIFEKINLDNLQQEVASIKNEGNFTEHETQKTLVEIFLLKINNTYAKLLEILRLTKPKEPKYQAVRRVIKTIPLSVRPTQKDIAFVHGILNQIESMDGHIASRSSVLH